MDCLIRSTCGSYYWYCDLRWVLALVLAVVVGVSTHDGRAQLRVLDLVRTWVGVWPDDNTSHLSPSIDFCVFATFVFYVAAGSVYSAVVGAVVLLFGVRTGRAGSAAV